MAIGTVGALLASSAIGAVGSGIAAKKGADAQADAAAASNDTQRYIYDDGVERGKPWEDAGLNALNQYQYMLGLSDSPTNASWRPPEIFQNPGETTYEYDEMLKQGPAGDRDDSRMVGGYKPIVGPSTYSVNDETFDTRREAQDYASSLRPQGDGTSMADRFDVFRNNPGYQFQMEEGEQALQRSAASRGMLNSGAFAKDAIRFSQGMADQSYGNYMNRLSGLAGVGQTQVSQTNALGQNYASAVGQNNMIAGNARASGYQGMSNALNSGINNGFSIYGAYKGGMFE